MSCVSEFHMVSEGANDLMLGLNETMDHLDVANSVRWYGHVLRREDGQV